VGGLRSKKVWSFPARNTVHVVAFKKEQARFFGHRWVIPIDNANVVA